jgi:hypothetical protein
MDTLETLPISRHDICDEVILHGDDDTMAVQEVAADMAQKLAQCGVQMRTDRTRVSDTQLARAGIAKLCWMQKFSAEGTPEIRQAVIAVSAAVSLLLGDLDNPAIDAMRKAA